MFRILLAAALSALAAAPGHATIRMEQVYPARAAANATERAILFTGEVRQTIDAFYRRNPGKSVARSAGAPRDPLLIRERLPDGAATRPLPLALESQLSPLPRGYARVIVGRDIVLLERRSQTILDIMRAVVR